jgi:UDPglucose--hexose-1-phosphate uridylyltransferase
MKIENTHRRFNPLIGEWVLVSPHRAKRPWQGKVEQHSTFSVHNYDPNCYLCPTNKRANNEFNPIYTDTYVFNNDFSSLQPEVAELNENKIELLRVKSEKGICRVVCFSPKHNLTLAELELADIVKVVRTWKDEYSSLGSKPFINHVQIFENKGEIMGCSNPHPHGQIWAQETIPNELFKEQTNQYNYYKENHRTLLSDYINIEKQELERIVHENENFILLVPFWAVWPFETMIISKRSINSILQLSEQEITDFADIIKTTTVKYDNIFEVSFPYSSGIHQAPTDGLEHKEWHFHMHFYPPLLKSAEIKKFMVGYELLAEPQRDITPESAAKILKQLSSLHFNKF